MKAFFVTISILIFTSVIAQPSPEVKAIDFAVIFGQMNGSLTYLDYSSGKPYTMPANIFTKINPKNSSEIIQMVSYPDEPKANGIDSFRISKDGKMLNNLAITSRKQLSNGSLELVGERKGQDGNDNKNAILRYTYTLGKNIFVIKKEVLFDGEKNWVLRHTYSCKR